MSDLKSELGKLIPLYCAELDSIDVSECADVRFSENFEKQMSQLVRTRKKSRRPLIKSAGRRIAALIAAAVLLGTLAAAAYAPARNAFRQFFINTFGGYSIVEPAVDSNSADGHKDKIERRYEIDVPDGFELNAEESYTGDDYCETAYYSADSGESLYFSQFTESAYKSYYDDEYGELTVKTDSDGGEITVYSGEEFTSIVWDNGEYIFELNGDMSEAELMEIYSTVR
jgi:hypothetical protein